MIPEIQKMLEELMALSAEKEREFLLEEYCPVRIKNSIFNMRNKIISFSVQAEKDITDMSVRPMVLNEYSDRFNEIKNSIDKIRIKTAN